MFSKTSKVPVVDNSSNNAATGKKGIPTVISHGTNILGNIVSDVIVDIDGSVEGNVRAEQITVRANGKIVGDITANIVHIYGNVRGLIRAHEVHLYSSAHVTGVIVHKSLTVEDGAFVDAKFKRASDESGYAAEVLDTGEDDSDGFIESAPSFVGTNASLRLIG